MAPTKISTGAATLSHNLGEEFPGKKMPQRTTTLPIGTIFSDFFCRLIHFAVGEGHITSRFKKPEERTEKEEGNGLTDLLRFVSERFFLPESVRNEYASFNPILDDQTGNTTTGLKMSVIDMKLRRS